MQNIYQAEHLKRANYSVPLMEEKQIAKELEKRTDVEAERLKRYMSMPDLTRTEGSPVKAITEIVANISSFKNFDIIETPEIISPVVVFDLFNFPKIIRLEALVIHIMLMMNTY